MSLKKLGERDRIDTFKECDVGKKNVETISWPYHTPSVEKMAKFGFIYTPTKTKRDQVFCLGCSKKDSNWKGVKNIAKHHLLSSPKCGYALFHNAWNNRDYYTESQSDLSFIKKNKSKPGRKTKNARSSASEYDWSQIEVFSDPMSRECVRVRKSFFQNWISQSPSASQMIQAGFYNFPTKESKDTTICLYCKLSLEDWSEGDDPYKEHQRMSPNCYFFRSRTSKARGRKRGSDKRQLDTGDDSGALIVSSFNSLNKRTKRNNAKLLDDTSSESLNFLANFAQANKENHRNSEDYEGLVSSEKSFKRSRSVRYNTSNNSSRSQVMRVTKKKNGLLFKSDDEEKDAATRNRRGRKANDTNTSQDLLGESTRNKPDNTMENETDNFQTPQKGDSINDDQNKNENQLDDGANDPGELPSSPLQVISRHISPISRHMSPQISPSMPLSPTARQRTQGGSPIRAQEASPYRSPNKSAHQSFNKSHTKSPNKSPNKSQAKTPASSPVRIKNPFRQQALSEPEHSDSEIIDDSALISPEKKDPTLYSSSTPLSKLPSSAKFQKVESTRIDYTNYSLNPVNFEDSDYDVSISLVEKVSPQKLEIPKRAPKLIDNSNILSEALTEVSPVRNQSIRAAESTPMASNWEAPLLDEVDAEVLMKQAANEIVEMAEGEKAKAEESEAEEYLNQITESPFWTAKSRKDITHKFEDLTKANDFLKQISELDYQLSEDIDGVLTRFVSQIPEKEMEMTISEWIEHQTEQCKKLLNLKCEDMIKEFEQSSEKAIEFIMKM